MIQRRRQHFTKEIQAIRRSVKSLERAVRRLASAVRKERRSAVVAGHRPGHRKLNLSPKRLAALKLQGSYLGYMRQLSIGQKSRVRAVRERQGVRAAVKVARRLAVGRR